MDDRTRAGLRSEHGSAVVEFALVLPLLLMLLFGIVQFSLMYNRQQALHAAAREGARVASLETSTAAGITSAIDGALTGVPLSSPRKITLAPAVDRPCQGNSGQTVTVSVAAASDLDIPMWRSTTVGLTGRATFRCE